MGSQDSGDMLSESMMRKLLDESKFGGKRRTTAPVGQSTPLSKTVYVDGQDLKVDDNDGDLQIGTADLSNTEH